MGPIDRVVRSLGDIALPARLAELAGSDLTTLLLDVFGRRADATTPAMVMRQRARDRFVPPGRIDARSLHRVEAALLAALPDEVEPVVLSPLAPLGAHASIASVDQDRVVSANRLTEVAADPTVGLAIEAAVSRRALLDEHPKSVERVRLAAIQRIVRAQQFDAPMSFSHFTLLGVVTAGRDTGSHRFEVETMAEHAIIVSTCLLAVGADHVVVTVADWTDDALTEVPGRIGEAFSGDAVTVLEEPTRTRARDYYLEGALEVEATFRGSTFSVADGGLVDWTRGLVASRKERLMISGIGVDRLALAIE